MELYLSLAFFQNSLLNYEKAMMKEVRDGPISSGIWRMPSGVHRTELRSGQVRSATPSEDMEVYLAGIEGRQKMLLGQDQEGASNLISTANILQSFFYADDITEKYIIPQAKRFLLDSGAFTFMQTNPAGVDWNDYVKRYAEFINRNHVERFFELDIDPIIGYENVLKLRQDLERRTGKQCIPVWHKSRGMDAFDVMCENYDYVSIGGIVSKEIKQSEWRFFPDFINRAHRKGARIHGLGFTAVSALHKYHFDSVDSTAWVTGNRFGGVYQYKHGTIIKHNKPEGMRMADARTLAIHNFREWVRFADFAEVSL